MVVIVSNSSEGVLQLIRDIELTDKVQYRRVSVTAKFGSEDWNSDRVGTKVLWGDDDVFKYDGIPYIVVGRLMMECRSGPQRYGSRYERPVETSDHGYGKHRRKVQTSIKLGCPAKVYIHHVVRFPQFAIAKNAKHLRRRKSEELRKAIDNNASGIIIEVVFAAKVADISAHQYHYIGPLSETSLALDDRCRRQISELVTSGVRRLNDMRRRLAEYVEGDLFCGQTVPPKTDARFWPSPKTILNTMYQATLKLRLSDCDETNVKALISEWRENGFDDLIEIYLSDDSDSNVVFVHQSQWQRRMLMRYGNNICLIDATYSTTRYDLALFMLCVPTNAGYVVVATMLLLEETAKAIEEGLSILSRWNPNWHPQYFMSDFSEAQIRAIEAIFKDSQVRLCKFHRLQAWRRRLSACTHRDTLISMFKDIADSCTEQKYIENVESLKKSQPWIESESIHSWFENTWLEESKRWVRCYADPLLYCLVSTTNGLERQNERLKYTYMSHYASGSLTDLVTAVTRQFVPDSERKYNCENVSWLSTVRSYATNVPPFLHNRPTYFVRHCATRLSSGISSEHITVVTDGQFSVSSGDQQYMVTLTSNVPSCECLDWKKHCLPCKHMLAVLVHVPTWNWDRLPKSYRDFPSFIIDEDVVNDVSLQITQTTVSDSVEQLSFTNEPSEAVSIVSSADEPSLLTNASALGDVPVEADIKHLQSKLRQSLNILLSYSHHIQDQAFLTDSLVTLQQEINKYKEKATVSLGGHRRIRLHGQVMQQRKRFRRHVVKHNTGAGLKQRTKMSKVRRRRRQKLLQSKNKVFNSKASSGIGNDDGLVIEEPVNETLQHISATFDTTAEASTNSPSGTGEVRSDPATVEQTLIDSPRLQNIELAVSKVVHTPTPGLVNVNNTCFVNAFLQTVGSLDDISCRSVAVRQGLSDHIHTSAHDCLDCVPCAVHCGIQGDASILRNLLRSPLVTCDSCSVTESRMLCSAIESLEMGSSIHAVSIQTLITNCNYHRQRILRHCDVNSCLGKSAHMETKWVTASVHLLLHLKRWSAVGSKSSRHVTLSDHIILDLQEGQVVYELTAVLMHTGETSEDGHYTTLVRSGNNWIKCNDEKLTKSSIDIQTVGRSAYVCAYTRLDCQPDTGTYLQCPDVRAESSRLRQSPKKTKMRASWVVPPAKRPKSHKQSSECTADIQADCRDESDNTQHDLMLEATSDVASPMQTPIKDSSTLSAPVVKRRVKRLILGNVPTTEDESDITQHEVMLEGTSDVASLMQTTVVGNEVSDDTLPDLEEQPMESDPHTFRKRRIEEDFEEFRLIREYSWYNYKHDLLRFMEYFNGLLFDNKLPTSQNCLKVAKAPTKRKYERVNCCGCTFLTQCEEDSTKLQFIGISVDPQRCDTSNLPADEVATLLHECIHAYLYIIGACDRNSNQGHGPVFMACLQECVDKLASLDHHLPGPVFADGTELPLNSRFRNIVLTYELVAGNLRNTPWCT